MGQGNTRLMEMWNLVCVVPWPVTSLQGYLCFNLSCVSHYLSKQWLQKGALRGTSRPGPWRSLWRALGFRMTGAWGCWLAALAPKAESSCGGAFFNRPNITFHVHEWCMDGIIYQSHQENSMKAHRANRWPKAWDAVYKYNNLIIMLTVPRCNGLSCFGQSSYFVRIQVYHNVYLCIYHSAIRIELGKNTWNILI